MVRKKPTPHIDNSLSALIREVVYKGNSVTYYLDIAGREVIALEYEKTINAVPERGSEVYAEFEATAFCLLEQE